MDYTYEELRRKKEFIMMLVEYYDHLCSLEMANFPVYYGPEYHVKKYEEKLAKEWIAVYRIQRWWRKQPHGYVGR